MDMRSLIIIQYLNYKEESAKVLSLKEWKLVNRQNLMIGEKITAHKNLYRSDNIMKFY